MRGKSSGFALLLAVAFTVLFIVSVPDDYLAAEDEPEVPVTTLQGYIYELPPLEDLSPASDVIVTTWVDSTNKYDSVTTDDKGMFNIKYDSNVQYISFEKSEFTIKVFYSADLEKYGDTGKYILKKENIKSYTDGVYKLYDSSGWTAVISRTVSSVSGYITTVIDNADVPINNANVTLASSSGLLTAETNERGYFSISCSSGTAYKMLVEAGGFEDWSEDNVYASENPIKISLTQRNHELILGLDLSHTLALFGCLLMLLIALVATVLIKRPEKEDGLMIINDLHPIKKKQKKN